MIQGLFVLSFPLDALKYPPTLHIHPQHNACSKNTNTDSVVCLFHQRIKNFHCLNVVSVMVRWFSEPNQILQSNVFFFPEMSFYIITAAITVLF